VDLVAAGAQEAEPPVGGGGQGGALPVAEALRLAGRRGRLERRAYRHLRQAADVGELLAHEPGLELRLRGGPDVLPGAATAAPHRLPAVRHTLADDLLDQPDRLRGG
jgi:hypothetical protein